MGRARPDVLGKTFNRWTPVRIAVDGEKQKARRWWCRCSCPDGTERAVSEEHLLSGRSASCGCLKRENVSKRLTGSGIDLVGKVFDDLTVNQRAGQGRWLCSCACGTPSVVVTQATLLRSSFRRSCGCLNSYRMLSDITGKRFHRLVARTPPSFSRSNKWLCDCDCGTKGHAINRQALGTVQSCGCILIERKFNGSLFEVDGRFVLVDVRGGMKPDFVAECLEAKPEPDPGITLIPAMPNEHPRPWPTLPVRRDIAA